MKTIQCAHPPHHHNGFVATYRLWTASSGVHALLVLEPTECSTSTVYLYYALCFMLVEHSVCHEPISVLINAYKYIYIYIYIYIYLCIYLSMYLSIYLLIYISKQK